MLIILKQSPHQVHKSYRSTLKSRVYCWYGSHSGFSGADMATLCREAALGPIRDMSFGDIEHISADQVKPK